VAVTGGFRFRRREDKPIIHIQATIHVERDSQKGILIRHRAAGC